ncbi:MAG: DNA polymerase I [Ruminococcaceae bacterium]|jgi:DNA polymerase-1|nr:DNA polymerase I [Oscillospiraceae bacterium]
MKLLVLDGNSILNRAFYGIKLLTTKDGRFTNGITGFLNILLKLNSEVNPDAVAIAFDLKAPTFRHKMYDGYKAQRKGMPPELAEQMPVLKELLRALGYKLVEKEGYEADDILGTLSACCKGDDHCYIATGDRDSLQLVNDNVTVLLASTKMGGQQTVYYDEKKVLEDYLVTPKQLIDIKALMGDSSDNIPGVAGVGQKTATDLIVKYKNIDYIYENLSSLDIKEGVRQKLANDKDMAYLSRTLGTICLEAPIDTDISSYIPSAPDTKEAVRILTSLEMFRMIEKFSLDEESLTEREKTENTPSVSVMFDGNENFLNSKSVFIDYEISGNGLSVVCFADGKVNEVKNYKELFENGDIEKTVFDVKPLCNYLSKNGIEIKNVKVDLILAAYVLNPSSSTYELDRLLQEYSVNSVSVEGCPENLLKRAEKAASLMPLREKMLAEITVNNQEELLFNIEMPLAKVLSSMEVLGFEVDKKGIEDFGEMLSGRISEIQSRIYEAAGEEFNINSPKQLGVILFEKLNIPAKKKTKSGYSTNADVLESLESEYPIVRDILEYRTLTKLSSTYCEGLLKEIESDGRIHSTFKQTETRTGRISSTEPNLQNIPVRQELGREMRKFFKASEGKVLIDADYSQIELRVLADAADDKVMLDAFNNDVDIHAITASQVFNMPLMMVTPTMRSRAKAVNFGIVYGIGAFSLAKDIGVTRAEADKYIKDYLYHYSGVNAYMQNEVKLAKENGYAKTLFNRRRYLPELSSSNGMLRAFGERVARNMPIQGTAADIIKIAMIKTYERLEKEKMSSRLILQIHDELIVEAPENEAEKAAEILKEEMENACKLKVKLVAAVGTGKTWYEAKK